MFSLFGKKNGPSMATILEDMKSEPSPSLLDVRTRGEYAGGHIPGSINLPLDQLQGITNLVTDKEATVFVYCATGSRSGFAASQLKRMGYTNAKNMGGIMSYRGPVERC